jgi:hypothetical protein
MYFIQWMNEEVGSSVWDKKLNVAKLLKHTGAIFITFIHHIEKYFK